jgi:hypothetical protein
VRPTSHYTPLRTSGKLLPKTAPVERKAWALRDVSFMRGVLRPMLPWTNQVIAVNRSAAGVNVPTEFHAIAATRCRAAALANLAIVSVGPVSIRKRLQLEDRAGIVGKRPGDLIKLAGVRAPEGPASNRRLWQSVPRRLLHAVGRRVAATQTRGPVSLLHAL